jgi:ferrochelatase
MAYGTPRTPADIPAYYTDIRRGRPPSEMQLADLQRRYDALGGISRLGERTEAQRSGLQAALDERAPGRTRVLLGQRHAAPFIEDAVADAAAGGAERLVGLVLAPHFSGFSIGHYRDRLAAAAAGHGLAATTVPHWHLLPAYLDFVTAAVRDALDELGTDPDATKVFFTAHSLPERLLVDDPYPDELREGAVAVAERLDLDRRGGWSLGWQSAGATPEPWRGPDILTVIRDLAEAGGTAGLVVCPHGFVADHLEVAYDLDIEARAVAEGVGLPFARTRVLNDDPTVLAGLADLVLTAAAAEPAAGT